MSRVVAIGGGHGLAATLTAVRQYADDVAGVVAVADDGGSTGRLLAAVHLPALGDLRKALVALADPGSRLAGAMPHRFHAGDIEGHAFGNLLIAGLAESGDGDLVAALDEVCRLIGAAGRVLPAAVEPVALRARTATGDEVAGQVRIMATSAIDRIWFEPAEPAVPAAAVSAIAAADQIVLGPGSLFTSVLAAVAVPGIRAAVAGSAAPVVYVCNLRPQEGETSGYALADHLAALERHDVRPDVVLHDPDLIGGEVAGAGAHAATLVPAPLAAASGLAHDPTLLAKALAELL